MIHALAEDVNSTACGKPLARNWPYNEVNVDLTADGEHVYGDPKMANCIDCMEAA